MPPLKHTQLGRELLNVLLYLFHCCLIFSASFIIQSLPVYQLACFSSCDDHQQMAAHLVLHNEFITFSKVIYFIICSAVSHLNNQVFNLIFCIFLCTLCSGLLKSVSYDIKHDSCLFFDFVKQNSLFGLKKFYKSESTKPLELKFGFIIIRRLGVSSSSSETGAEQCANQTTLC